MCVCARVQSIIINVQLHISQPVQSELVASTEHITKLQAEVDQLRQSLLSDDTTQQHQHSVSDEVVPATDMDTGGGNNSGNAP